MPAITEVAQRIREHHHARQLAGQRRERSSIISHIARSEDQRRFAAMQIGELALELGMEMIVSGDVGRPPAPAPTVRNDSSIAASTAGCGPMPR